MAKEKSVRKSQRLPESHDALGKLAKSYRQTLVAEFARLAADVEINPALTAQEKVDTLYEAMGELLTIIERVDRPAPENAPELWRKRADKSEKIFDFIRRVYGPYLGRIKRSDLRRLDFSLYKSLYYKPHKEEADVSLPTIKEANDRLLAQLDGNVSISEIRHEMPPVLRDRLRLYRTLLTRKKRARAD